MKIVKLKGGLGNQMFQYAFAKNLSLKTKEEIKLDTTTFYFSENRNKNFPKIFNFNISFPAANKFEINKMCTFKKFGNPISYEYKTKIFFETIFNKKYFFKRDRNYIPVDLLTHYDYFDGYWQSYEYVDNVFELLKNEFIPKDDLSFETKKTIQEVSNSDSVFVGVRHGDYAMENKKYGIFGQSYYNEAMRYIESYVSNPIYYIFTNDFEWTKNNLDFGNRKIIMRSKELITSDFEELFIMSECKHSIIANSTFHWWGARLNYYDGKIVISPDKWSFEGLPNRIIPPYWVKIRNS